MCGADLFLLTPRDFWTLEVIFLLEYPAGELKLLELDGTVLEPDLVWIGDLGGDGCGGDSCGGDSCGGDSCGGVAQG